MAIISETLLSHPPKLQQVWSEHAFFPPKLTVDLWISVVVVEDAVLVSLSQ